jgi:hypothetical protein
MIKQEILLLQADTNRQGIVIQDQIVHYYIQSYNMIATQSAVLAGFAFSGFSFHDGWDSFNPLHRMIFVNACTASVSCNIAAVVLATHCSIQAPGLQLLGPEGSTARACRLLKRWHEFTLWAHNLGLMFFVISICDIGFLQFDMPNTVGLISQCVIAVICVFYSVFRIYNEFSFHANIDMDPTMGMSSTSKIMDPRYHPGSYIDMYHPLLTVLTPSPTHTIQARTRPEIKCHIDVCEWIDAPRSQDSNIA